MIIAVLKQQLIGNIVVLFCTPFNTAWHASENIAILNVSEKQCSCNIYVLEKQSVHFSVINYYYYKIIDSAEFIVTCYIITKRALSLCSSCTLIEIIMACYMHLKLGSKSQCPWYSDYPKWNKIKVLFIQITLRKREKVSEFTYLLAKNWRDVEKDEYEYLCMHDHKIWASSGSYLGHSHIYALTLGKRHSDNIKHDTNSRVQLFT